MRNIKILSVILSVILFSLLSCGGIEDLYDKVSKEKVIYYSVLYDGNGNESGSVPVDSNLYKEGESFNVFGNSGSLTKTGYSFNGWNLQSNGNGDFYDENYSFTVGTSNLTFFAQWLGAKWGRTVSSTFANSQIASVAVDSSGNVYAAGSIDGTEMFEFNEATISLNLTRSSSNNILLIKYNSSGVAQWAKSLVSGTNPSLFNSVAVDSSGNVYCAGTVNNNTVTFDFGDYSSVFNPPYNGANFVLAKYDSNGITQWVKVSDAAPDQSTFESVAVAPDGSIYAAGYLNSNTLFMIKSTLPQVMVQGNFNGNNALLVKYDPSGVVQWAKSVPVATGISMFNSVAVDKSGNVYAAGSIMGTGSYSFDGITNINGFSITDNVVLVKYDPEGNVLWTRTVQPGSSSAPTHFKGVSTDSAGNVYVAGGILGTATMFFGDNVSTSGNYNASYNVLLVKYTPSGIAQWAKSLVSAQGQSEYKSVSVDSAGNCYAGGFIYGNNPYVISELHSVTGANSGNNMLLVKYNASGAVQWAKTVDPASDQKDTILNSVVNYNGIVYAAGFMNGTGIFNFGNGITLTGFAPDNILVIKYK